MNDEDQALLEPGWKPTVVHPGPPSIEDLLRHVDPAPDDETERRRHLCGSMHSSAQRWADALRDSELILSFMSIAEMRMGAIAAGWGVRRRTLLEQFIRGFGAVYADDALCTSWATLRADAR